MLELEPISAGRPSLRRCTRTRSDVPQPRRQQSPIIVEDVEFGAPAIVAFVDGITFEGEIGFDRLKKRRYPDPNTTGQSSPTDYEEYGYNAAGQVTTHTRRSAHTIQFSYFNTGELKKWNPQNEPATTFEYDLLGRVTSETRDNKTLTTKYDALSRVTSEDSSIGTVIYEYDPAGRRTKLSYPGASTSSTTTTPPAT